MNKILQAPNKNYSRTRDQSEMTLSLSFFFSFFLFILTGGTLKHNRQKKVFKQNISLMANYATSIQS